MRLFQRRTSCSQEAPEPSALSSRLSDHTGCLLGFGFESKIEYNCAGADSYMWHSCGSVWYSRWMYSLRLYLNNTSFIYYAALATVSREERPTRDPKFEPGHSTEVDGVKDRLKEYHHATGCLGEHPHWRLYPFLYHHPEVKKLSSNDV